MSPIRTVSDSILGRRLRFARESMGLSTRDVAVELIAKGISLTHATVGNYERGSSDPSQECLEALSQVYQRPEDWLRGRGHEITGTRYRCLKATRQYQKRCYEGDAQRWLEIYMFVEQLLRQRLKNKWNDFRVKSSQSGADAASRLRSRLRLGDYPLPSTVRLLEDFGIYVTDLHADAPIDGMASRFGKHRSVVLNSAVPSDRMRLNALHELAHHIYEDCIVDERLAHEEIEHRAFEFASSMLIPDAMLQRAFQPKSIVRLVQFKERYGISLAAMMYRARRRDYISQRHYQRIMIEFSKHGLRKNEPGRVTADRPVRMESLIDAAVLGDKSSYRELAQVSGLPAELIEERVHAARRTEQTQQQDDQSDSFNFESYRSEFEHGDPA